jgi:hypothetical protein
VRFRILQHFPTDKRLMNACVIDRKTEGSLAVSAARDDRKSLYLDFLPQIGRHVEVFAFDNGWLTFFKPTTVDGLEL